MVKITKEEFERTGPYYCGCECGDLIEWKEHYIYYGIPIYINHHNIKVKKQKKTVDIIDIIRYKKAISEKKKKYRREYYEKNKDRLKTKQKQYYEYNKDKILEKQKHDLKHKEYSEQYRLKHKKESKQSNMQYRLEHPEQEKARVKKYQQSSKGKRNVKKHQAKRNRELGYTVLNEWDIDNADYVGHHIDKINVIYIPVKIHKSTKHSVLNNKNMNTINETVFYWYFIQWYAEYYGLVQLTKPDFNTDIKITSLYLKS